MLVLDLDGTLTNSKKELTEPTRQALLHIQENGKKVVLASGRPINGVLPLAEKLELQKYGSYILSFNGARITQCSTGKTIINKIPPGVIEPIYRFIRNFPGLDIVSYDADTIISGIAPNEYTQTEAFINKMEVRVADDFPSALSFPVNKLLIPGEPAVLETCMSQLRRNITAS